MFRTMCRHNLRKEYPRVEVAAIAPLERARGNAAPVGTRSRPLQQSSRLFMKRQLCMIGWNRSCRDDNAAR
jgi:hypothetical protein